MTTSDRASGTTGLPLAGIRVLDFTHAAAGPYATMFLADLGAEVIKVEKPRRGDGARYMGAPMLGPLESDYFVAINRGKRDVTLDLRSERGQEAARRLAENCDIVLQNFRPGVMDRLGLGFDDLSARRPGIIYGSISAFGTEGPWRDRPANDIILQSVSGLMGVTGEVGGGPVRMGTPVSDYSAGLFCLVGVLAALHARDEHPEGQHIKISMIDASVALLANYIPAVVGKGHQIPRLGRGHAQIVPYQALECSDGSFIMIGAFTNGFWRSLCVAIGREEWIDDERFATNAARVQNRDVLIPALAEIIRTRTREEWQDTLDVADVPNSPVLELHETLELEQVKVNGTVQWVGEGDSAVPTARNPVRSAAWPDGAPSSPPRLGEHSVEILRELGGFSEDDIGVLIAEGITDTPMTRATRG
ncbi:CaiB/BaiF CoA-transferase family protein [Microbacterium aoyamense]|uniref:CaiB/BaiF CoA-transferase family protein n=1 Tax=Microbacterium aoyamense TaxID=344166 RepID=A0ABP5ALK4_9MICO|nr:CoA transferase [Microbacterium aoyamense]